MGLVHPLPTMSPDQMLYGAYKVIATPDPANIPIFVSIPDLKGYIYCRLSRRAGQKVFLMDPRWPKRVSPDILYRKGILNDL